MIDLERMEDNQDEITGLLRSTGRDGIEKLIGWLEDTDYFTAPASTRLDFHGCHLGGLAEHSLNVYKLFDQKVKQYGLDLSPDEVIISSLLHDACKIGLYVPVPKKENKRKKKTSCVEEAEKEPVKPYKVQDDLPLGHGEKSLYLISQYIRPTLQEALLIRWHMGPFDAAYDDDRFEKMGKTCPAIYAFSCADQEASRYLDERRKSNS